MRRRLTGLRLDKIAVVDKPCQEHAVVAIVKRAPDGPLAIAKATFQEALDAQLVSQRVQNAFYGCFDNLWSRNDAFRTAMTDEIEAGGDGSEAADAWVASVKELADHAVAAAKENGGKPTEAELSGAMEKAVASYLSKQEQTMHKFTTKAALQAAVSGFAIAKASAQDVADIRESAVALGETAILPAEGPLAMTVQTADPATATEIATLKRRADVAEMPANVRKHYDGLDEAGQTAFLAKTAAQRASDVDAVEKGDPVLYTTAAGVVVRKSDGAVAAALAKQVDEQAGVIKGLQSTTGDAVIEKRAATEFPNVAKATAVSVLKTATAVGIDTPEGADMVKSLTTMNKAGTGLFKQLGSVDGGGDGNTDVKKAAQDFDSAVTAIAKRDGCPRSDAMTKARTEHADLFAAAYPAPEAVAA